MTTITTQLVETGFAEAFARPATAVVSAPGRVNLIGEHTDYNDGFVLPAAIDYYTYIALAPSHKPEHARLLEVVAYNFANERISIDLDQPMVHDPKASWPNYVRGVVKELLASGLRLAGGQLYIAGDVPAGAGLSSSASLEMALVRALLSLSGETLDPTQAALIGQAAENHFVGCNCGIMDQLISARGQAGSALLIDCQDLSLRPVSIPADWEILIVHSGVKRGLVDSEYNQRRQQCEAAAAFFGKRSLRELSLDELRAAEGKLDALSYKRAHHVLSENQRTLQAAEALSNGDMPSLARAMAESHASMRDDFNITVPAIDTLVDILTRAAAGEGGARMTGGGFGGCVVALAPAAVIPRLIAAVEQNYEALTGCTPRLIRARASAGAFHR